MKEKETHYDGIANLANKKFDELMRFTPEYLAVKKTLAAFIVKIGERRGRMDEIENLRAGGFFAIMNIRFYCISSDELTSLAQFRYFHFMLLTQYAMNKKI